MRAGMCSDGLALRSGAALRLGYEEKGGQAALLAAQGERVEVKGKQQLSYVSRNQQNALK